MPEKSKARHRPRGERPREIPENSRPHWSPHSLRRQRVHFVEYADCLQNGFTHNFQALGAELVDRILRRVPEHVLVAVVEVDQVGAWYAALYERKVIVADGHGSREEMRLIAKPGS